MKSFRAVVSTAVGPVFYSWVFGFGGKVSIKSPEDVKKSYAAMVKPVSYTHLDVYKRQRQDSGCASWPSPVLWLKNRAIPQDFRFCPAMFRLFVGQVRPPEPRLV